MLSRIFVSGNVRKDLLMSAGMMGAMDGGLAALSAEDGQSKLKAAAKGLARGAGVGAVWGLGSNITRNVGNGSTYRDAAKKLGRGLLGRQ
jgi:hypothetical protein